MKATPIKIGTYVQIETLDTQKEVFGFVKTILSKPASSELKVELQSGEQGWVIDTPSLEKIKQMNFKFYNLFFHETIYLLRDRKTQDLIIFPSQTIFLTNHPHEFQEKMNPKWYWKGYSKQKALIPLLEKHQIQTVILNQQRQLTLAQFQTLEHQFKTILP